MTILLRYELLPRFIIIIVDNLPSLSMQTFTRTQQTRNVALLGVTFMIMFTSFNSLQNIVSKIYGDYGYQNLGETSVLLLYFTFGATTFITPYVIRKFGSLGYAVYEGAGLIIAEFQDMPKIMGWIIVLVGAMLCGASASMIWVAQGSYVSTVAGQERRTELFGLFWMLMMSSQIVGNIITTFVLGKISNTVYFIVLTTLGVLSSLLFLLLPEVKQADDNQQFSIKSEAAKITAIVKNKRYRNLMMYFFFPGVSIAFYATFLFKLVALSIKQDPDEQEDDYKQRVSYYTGFVFIALGISQALTGFIMSRIGQKFCKFKLALIGTLWIEIAGFTSLLCYFLENYQLCFLVSFLWGSGQTFLQTNIGSLIGTIFPGKVQAYGVFRIILAMGTTLTIVLNIALQNIPPWVFLTVVMIVQVMTTGIANQIRELQNNNEQGGSLVTRHQQNQQRQ